MIMKFCHNYSHVLLNDLINQKPQKESTKENWLLLKMIEIIFTKSRGTYAKTKYPAVTITNNNKISKNQTSKTFGNFSIQYFETRINSIYRRNTLTLQHRDRQSDIVTHGQMKIIIINFCFNMDKNTGWVKQQLTWIYPF